jgi:uncharacterized membrane protein
MRVQIWLSYVIGVILLALLPYWFGSLMATSLAKLHIGHATAGVLVIAIIVGGFFNIPLARVEHSQEVATNPLAMFGLDELFPQLRRVHRQTIIAVNVGGCLIPLGLALYELSYLAALGLGLVGRVGAAVLVNIVVCYLLARPVPNVGIAMPGFVPPVVALTTALLLAPGEAPAAAFIAGVLGPLVGADLLHLRQVSKVATTGIASIGGAGTFDGIVLSGIVAAYLA